MKYAKHLRILPENKYEYWIKSDSKILFHFVDIQFEIFGVLVLKILLTKRKNAFALCF